MILFIFPAKGQDGLFKGKVLDADSHLPVSYANISVKELNTGCSADLKGEFSIILDKVPVHLLISHVGYETQQIRINTLPGELTIFLKEVARQLPEVEITTKGRPESFFKDDQYSILDYEVDSNLVYLLIYRYRLARSQLLCKTVNGDTVARSANLRFKPTGLKLDCLGFLHILSHDSAYQVLRLGNRLLLQYVYNLDEFKSTMSDCIASTDSLLYFREESYDHQTIYFFHVNRNNNRKEYFTRVRDEEKLKMLRKNPKDYLYHNMYSAPDNFDQMVDWAWANMILYRPNATTLLKVGDSLALFNTVDGTIDFYNLDAKFLGRITVPVNQTGEQNWSKEIFIDKSTHYLYTSFNTRGKSVLYIIDPATGQLKRILASDYLFPQKPRVHKNYFYYVYDVLGKSDNKQLCRQKLNF